MTNKKTQIQKCIDTYGIKDTEAKRIIETSNDYLSLDELRMKYQYPQMGVVLPDWLTDEELTKMAFSVAKLMYRPFFEREINVSELANMLYIQAQIKMYTIRAHAQLKHAMIMMSANIYRDLSRKYAHRSLSNIEDMSTSYVNSVDTHAYGFLYKYGGTTDTDAHFINMIRSIKSDKIRMILIITGYAVAEIDELYSDFCELFSTEDEKLLGQLDTILDALNLNDSINQSIIDKVENKSAHKRCRKSITFNFVLKALGLNRQKDYIINEIADVLY